MSKSVIGSRRPSRRARGIRRAIGTRVALWVAALACALAPAVALAGFQQLPFDEYLRQQEAVSLRWLFKNISPAGTAPGVVIASPSRQDPDYYYHWVRDAALVMDLVLDLYSREQGSTRAQMARTLNEYVEFSRQNQLSNAMTGLGEPKFFVDGRPYDGPWGRPQNDGPALRALVLSRWAKALLKEGKRSYVEAKLYRGQIPASTVIKADLEYVSHHWGEPNFDLWEEVKGHHFYTRMVQRAALLEGAELARAMGDGEAADWYVKQANELSRVLAHHWDGSRIRQTLGRVEGVDKKSGLDTATLLAVLHTDSVQGPFSLTDERVMTTLMQLEAEFNRIYDINKRGSPATAIGRYPEDIYYGGNPWVLTTAAYAEYYYRLAKVMSAKSGFRLSARQAKFFRYVLRDQKQLANSIKPNMDVKRGTPAYQSIILGLRAAGDEFLKRVQLHGHADGRLAEQIRRDNGFMESARDLTWSYASFLTAKWARP